MNLFKTKLIGAVVMMLAATGVSAAVFQIQVGGLNLTYTQATGAVCDSGGCPFITAGTGDGTTVDPLITMTFIEDGAVDLILTTGISADFAASIAAGTNPAIDATHSIIGAPQGVGVFDLLVNLAPGIATNISSGSVTFNNGAINMLGSGFSNIFSQNLPNNPAALGPEWVGTNPISWSFSSGLGTCTNGVCTYSGTGEISWSVPAPGSLALLALGLLGAGVFARRRAS